MATMLSHPETTDPDLSECSQANYSNSVGPLKILSVVNPITSQIDVVVYLAGARIGGTIISRDKPYVRFKGSVPGIQAEIQLIADYRNNRLNSDIEYTRETIGKIYDTSTLFNW